MNKSVVYGLGITLLAACLYLVISINRLQKQVDTLKKQQANIATESEDHNEDDDEEIELAVYMNRLQLYMNKLWFAAKNKNWELAAFYLEETEETMEEVAKHDIEEDGIRINEQMKTWGISAIEPIEKAIESKELNSFELEYTNLITNCNGCHTATKHNFIKIKTPDAPAFTNQVY